MLTSKVLVAQILIFCLLASPGTIFAQQPPAPAQQPLAPAAQPAVPIIENLKVLVLEGEGAINNIEKHVAKAPVIEVRDDNDKPVENATVVFRLPVTGPGGMFADQKNTKTAKTNSQGQAAATGLIPNNETGHFTIKVTASIGNRMGEATISQTNAIGVTATVAPKQHKVLGLGWKKIIIISALAGGAITGIILATRDTSPPTVTITPGPVTIGGR